MTPRLRTGRRGRPEGGWPLDRLLLGVASLRATRELFLQQEGRTAPGGSRPWDVTLWSGVSPQSAARALQRMETLELVRSTPSDRSWGARSYRLVPDHPLTPPLSRLFRVESRMVPRPRPLARPDRRGPGSRRSERQ